MVTIQKKLILAFPYHDPDGKLNVLFERAMPELKHIFSEICISATFPTLENNAEFVSVLKQNGCKVVANAAESNIGDHYRNALNLAVEIVGDNAIFFGFIDRILFAINSEYKADFITDVTADFIDMVLMERSEKAWATHPKQYRKIEQTANQMGTFLVGREIEFGNCGFLIHSDLARKILPQSNANSYTAGPEWILIALLMGIDPIIKKTDWLSWEDPFIEKIPADQLKAEREADKKEYIKRLEMNVPFIDLLIEKRFYDLLK